MEINVWGIRMKKRRRFWKRNIGLAFVMPWLIGLLVFKLYPLRPPLFTVDSYNLFKTASFTRLENYKYILGDKLIIKAFIQTFKYAFLTVPLRAYVRPVYCLHTQQ